MRTGDRPHRARLDRSTTALRRRPVPACALIGVLAVGAAAVASTPTSGLAPEIRVEDLRQDVRYLADDASGGRLTGSEGIERAARYVASAFEQAGLVPPPGLDDYFQPFSFASGVRLLEGKSRLAADGEGAAGAVEAPGPMRCIMRTRLTLRLKSFLRIANNHIEE